MDMRAALILTSALALVACNMSANAEEGTVGGPVTERSYGLSGFEAVSLGGPHDVIVSVGQAHSVRAEGPADTLENLRIGVENGSLKIDTNRSNGLSIGFGRTNRQKATIHVTMPAIRAAAIGGSGDIRIDRAQGPRFTASIGGSGDIDIASLQVDEASFSIAGSGGIRAAGRANRSKVSIAGSGDVNVSGLETRTASVSIAGSGDVRARAMETAKVSIVGSGDVSISGPAKCSVSKMGSGNVRCTG
jgi:hypothetical protein